MSRDAERKIKQLEDYVEMNRERFYSDSTFDNFSNDELQEFIDKGLTKLFESENIKTYEDAEKYLKENSTQLGVDMYFAKLYFNKYDLIK